MISPNRLQLEQRLIEDRSGYFDARTLLRHFSLINYAIPIERLTSYALDSRLQFESFNVGGVECGFISAVPFLDVDFSLYRLCPMIRLSFGQTNYRTYVRHRVSGARSVLFFGTTLGSRWVALPHTLWKMPWFRARYDIDCEYDEAKQRYSRYEFDIGSSWGRAEISIEDTGKPIGLYPGFDSFDEMKLVLTHPIEGYYNRRDEGLGTYSIWHPEMNLTSGIAKKLYFEVFDRLRLLDRDEMQRPHSIFITPEVEFKVHLPPTAC